MTLKIRKTLKSVLAGVVVATIASAAVIAPAAAGGSLSLNFTPNNAKDANALRTVFALYSIVKAVDSGASISQNGLNNLAGLGQNGFGNQGIIHQEGNGHSGTLQQNGNNNSYGVFQFGENTNADVTQNGNGQTGATIVIGW